MSTVTVYGPIADRVGAAVTTEHTGRTKFHSTPSLRYRRAQVRAPVHVNHEGDTLGHVEHLELLDDGQLIAFATVDTDRVDLTGDPWFWSPSIRDDGIVVDLLEASLTRSPATVGLRAVKVMDGDLRYRHVQHRWRDQTFSGWMRAMYERAGESAKADGPLTVYTRDDDTVINPYAPRVVERSHPLDPQNDPTYGHGRRLMRGPPGRILDVR